MPKVSKARKQRQESAAFARNSRITYLSRQASPSSAGATGSISAASTPPISIAPSEEDPEEIPDLDAEDHAQIQVQKFSSRPQSSHRRVPETVASAFD